MTSVDTALQPTDQTSPQPTKPKRISKRMRKVLADLATKGITQREAARRHGMNETHLSRELRKPQIQVFIAQKARETIATAPLRAAARILELVDAESEHVSLQASDRILTSEGILKSDQRAMSVNVSVQAGYVLDLRDDAASRRPVIEAKALIDHDQSPIDGPADSE